MYILIALTFLTSFTFLSFSQSKENWVDFKSAKFGFKIQIPKEPSFTTKAIITETGTMKMNIFAYQPLASEKDVNTFYGINITDYPNDAFDYKNKEDMNEFFKNSIQGSVKSVNGELVYEEIINFKGYPGRDYRVIIRNGTVTLRSKMIVVKNRVYTVTTITDKENDFNKSISKFMDSFQLTKKQ
jgi:hypothetical protein